MNDTSIELIRQLLRKKEAVIEQALKDKGFSMEDIKNSPELFTIVSNIRDPFDHLYYLAGRPEQIRIISIQKVPDIYFSQDQNNYKINADLKYYL